MKLSVGDWVRCERSAAAVGSWFRYAGRTGRIVTINRADREYGVRFTAGQNESPSWFHADELVKVTRPTSAPSISTSRERKVSAAEPKNATGDAA